MRTSSFLATLALLLVPLAGCGGQSCERQVVCDALEGALDERSEDCGLATVSSCPYDPLEVGPGAAIICDSAWSCVDKLDADRVPCDDLGELSLARCDLY